MNAINGILELTFLMSYVTGLVESISFAKDNILIFALIVILMTVAVIGLMLLICKKCTSVPCV